MAGVHGMAGSLMCYCCCCYNTFYERTGEWGWGILSSLQ